MAKSNVVTIIFEDTAPLDLAETLVAEKAEPRRLSPTERAEVERIARTQGLVKANAYMRELHASHVPSAGFGTSRMAVLRAACLRGLQEFAREREATMEPQADRPPAKSVPTTRAKARGV